jgi:hypothetical protein
MAMGQRNLRVSKRAAPRSAPSQTWGASKNRCVFHTTFIFSNRETPHRGLFFLSGDRSSVRASAPPFSSSRPRTPANRQL